MTKTPAASCEIPTVIIIIIIIIAVISGFTKGKLTSSRFRTRSQPTIVLQPVSYLFLNFSI